MLCVCCLLNSSDRKEFSSFFAADRKLYEELTKLEIKKSKLNICMSCKVKLKESAAFYQMCVESHKELSISSESQKESRTRRTKSLAEPELEPELYEADDISSDDEVPISRIKQQLQDENIRLTAEVQSEVIPIIRQTEVHSEIIERTVEETTDTKKDDGPDCGDSLLLVERLQGIKSWKCKDCEKVFATKFRLKAHTSQCLLS